MLQLSGAVFARLQSVSGRGTDISPELLSVVEDVLDMPHRRTFTNNDIVAIDDRTRIDDPVMVQLVIGAKTTILSLGEVRSLEAFILLLRVRIGTEEC